MNESGFVSEGDENPYDELDHPDLGDLIVVLLASTLAGLRDRLAADGFEDAASLVADLVEVADAYITSCSGSASESRKC